ncbi:MAG: hypothetical protein K9N49_04635, partial [Candidatus Marinimicrobia bacterium]|nr:hypothetical protein [Candidatus Neomarinimicrobiota bacterium]
DFVVITISTGDLDAMEPDLVIPERYGIFQTVGDTVGPGGWARAMRNIPVFERIAAQCVKYCPQAFILNYTNPMATLTQTLAQCTPQPVVGLCHGLFENYRHLMRIFKCEREDDIRATYGGVNHFFWMLDFTVKGQPGLPLLQRKLRGGKRLDDLMSTAYRDEAGHGSLRRLVASELFEEFGILPYFGDRHTSEFFGRYLAPARDRLKPYALQRTSIAERRRMFRHRQAYVAQLASGKREIELKPSRETAADIMAARCAGREFVDVMNLPNVGQIENLPRGAVVETPGLINATGFAAVAVGALPVPIQTVVLPHALNQALIVGAARTGDWEMAYQALINDPLCSHLSIPKIKAMGRKLLEANRAFLPRFFGRHRRSP